MTYAEQIAETVDGWVKAGRIQEGMRGQYIEMLTQGGLDQEVAGMFMRHSDYTRKTQEVAEERRRLEAERADAQQQFASRRAALEEWERDVKGEIQRLKQLESQYPEMTARIAAYEQALEDYGLKDQVKVSVASAPQGEPNMPQPTNPTNQPATQAQYLTRDEVGQFAQQLLQMQGTAFAVAGEHQRLFGQPLSDDIISEAIAANQDVRTFWESKYNVAGKRAEVAAREREAEIAKIREEERAKIMAEFTTDPSRLTGSSPITAPGPLKPVSEVFDKFSSRALLADDAPKAPELIPSQIAQSQRVNKAAAAWDKMFDADGNPRSQAGGPAGNF